MSARGWFVAAMVAATLAALVGLALRAERIEWPENPQITVRVVRPGGSAAAAYLHLARTVCRRAERAMVALHHAEPLDLVLLAYVNRLSDLLFVLARAANHRQGSPEERW